MALLAANIKQVAFRGVPLPNIWLLNLLMGHKKSTNVDAIDSFINELMESKAAKWKILNNNNKRVPLRKNAISQVTSAASSSRLTRIFDDLTSNPLVINIEPLEQSHIDNLIESAVQDENAQDVHLLFEQMLEYHRLPSRKVLHKLLEHFASTMDRQRLEQLKELCETISPELLQENKFLAYKALLQWNTGNSLNSLERFKEAVVDCSPETKAVIYGLLKGIVDETIGKKSEAVLLAVIDLGEYCLERFDDVYLLCYIWESSFRSQWYSDQEAAKTLFHRHEILRNVVAKRVGSLCLTFMQEFKIEPIYQLMELFLKYQMLAQCRQILIRLFEYQYWRQDLRACSEIVQNSIDLDIPLPDIYNRKLLDLLLGRADQRPLQATNAAALQKEKLRAKEYKLKF